MASSAFKASEKFRVTMVNSEGGSERVTVQLSLDGLKILNADGSRTMRIYNLRNVARWDLMDTSTVVWTKTDVDLEEKPLTLSADSNTIRNVVDTLASCCMQLAEVINNKEEAANLEELAAGGGRTRKAQKLPSVDSVEYWRSPDKSGWLQAQSDVMKIWRRRWFVLKQGYLFRFLSPDVSESVKPRGVVDLSKVQDVRDGRAVTGKANTLQLKTASGGSVCYVCESETEMVEWISALEGAIAKIVKQLAGVDDSSSSKSSSDRHRSSGSSRHHGGSGDRHGGGGGAGSSASEWAKQVERSLSQGSRRSAGVTPGGYGAGGSGSGGRASAPVGGYESYQQGISDYSQVSGAAGVAAAMDDLTLNYGGYQHPPAAAAAGGSSAYGSSGYGASGGYGAYCGSSTNAYGGSSGSNNAAAYGGSSANTGYGGSSSLTAYGSGGYGSYGSGQAAPAGGYGSSGAAAGGYGSDQAAATGAYGSSGAAAGGLGGSSSSSYPDGSGYYGSSPAAAPAYPDPNAAAGSYGATNGYGAYQQPHQQPQPVQTSDYYGAAGGYYQQQQQSPQQQQQQQPQQQQQQQPVVSLLDQVPSQQPAYPYYQAPAGQEVAAAAAAAAPPAPAALSPWQVHHTAEGRPYYYNSTTGTTQWEAPPGL